MPVKSLGTASVSVEAETSGFGKGLPAKIKAALAGSDREAKAAGKRIGRHIVDGIGDEVLRRTPALRRRINAMLRGITVTAKVKVNLDVDAGGVQAKRLAARLRGQLEGNIFGSLKSSSNMFGGLFGSLIPKSLPQLAAMLSGGAFAATALAGAINATGRELLNVVKLSAFLPASLAALSATVAAVKVGFLGVGDAISAVLSKDPTKLAEALKGLTPSARSFVLEIKKALPILDRIKSATQESLFKPLRGVFTNLINSLGPSLIRGLSTVAGSIGTLLAGIGSSLVSPETKAFLDSLFASTARIITTLSGPITSLLNALIKAAGAALPSLVDLAGGSLGSVIKKFADWLNQVVSDGRFQKFLDSASRTLSDIWYVIKEVALLFGVLFDDANLEGKSFLETIGDMIHSFREFAASPDGQFALRGIADAAKLAGLVIIGLIATIGVIIAAVGSFVSAVRSAIEWVGRLVGVTKGASSKGVVQGLRKLPGHAAGAIVRRPELATLAESGPEVVIPLTRPGRAKELAQQSGLTRMLDSSGNGHTTQVFYLGGEKIEAKMVEIADTRIVDAVEDASYGTRAA